MFQAGKNDRRREKTYDKRKKENRYSKGMPFMK